MGKSKPVITDRGIIVTVNRDGKTINVGVPIDGFTNYRTLSYPDLDMQGNRGFRIDKQIIDIVRRNADSIRAAAKSIMDKE